MGVSLTKKELKKECRSKIEILEELIELSKTKQLGSKTREEYAILIAIVLRTLTCRVSGSDGLIKQCEYDKNLLFPLYDPIEVFNLLPSYRLIQFKVNNNKVALEVKDDLQNNERIYKTYLSFDPWLYEAVIDFKDKDYPPLSRYEIIRLIADKRGAHFDPNLDGRLYKITHEYVLPIIIEGQASNENLYTETIIGIAEELIFSFRYFAEAKPMFVNTEDFIYIQEYDNQPKNTFKYLRAKTQINAYNANQHFKCKTEEKEGQIYKITFREKPFLVAIIDL